MTPSEGDTVEVTKKEALVNNVPGLLTYALGSLVMFRVWAVLGVLYVLSCVAGIVLFWRLVCPSCPSYDKRCYPCGYGKASSKFFRKGDSARFAKTFRVYLPVLSLPWFVPLAGGIVLLAWHLDPHVLLTFVLFVLIGFVVVPLFSRVHGCRECSMREECPWAG